jgi:hypothetical protein
MALCRINTLRRDARTLSPLVNGSELKSTPKAAAWDMESSECEEKGRERS